MATALPSAGAVLPFAALRSLKRLRSRWSKISKQTETQSIEIFNKYGLLAFLPITKSPSCDSDASNWNLAYYDCGHEESGCSYKYSYRDHEAVKA